MKEYWIIYKPFLYFLFRFISVYVVLTFAYQNYLTQFDESKFEVDQMTDLVAKHTKQILLLFNFDVAISPHESEASVKFFFNDKFMVRIVEGCNAVSVIILFVTFILAFTGKWKSTLFFCIGGSFLIYVLNVIRIALLVGLIYYYPAQEHILHDVIFPLFIYSSVFLLWIIWVYKFSIYAKK